MVNQIITFDDNGNAIVQDTVGGEEAVEFLIELGLITDPVVDDSNILTDDDNNVLIL
jgi:hypothetical protein